MIVHYGDIFGCEIFQSGQQFFLVAPQGTEPELLIANGFVQIADGNWHHYLTALELQYIQAHRDEPELRLQIAVDTQEETPEDKQRAITLCLISLGLGILGTLSVFTISLAEMEYAWIEMLGDGFGGLCVLASFVIMIITRIKYPRSLFGKILMWVYIGLFILQVLIFVAVAIACGIGMAACFNDLRNCRLN